MAGFVATVLVAVHRGATAGRVSTPRHWGRISSCHPHVSIRMATSSLRRTGPKMSFSSPAVSSDLPPAWIGHRVPRYGAQERSL